MQRELDFMADETDTTQAPAATEAPAQKKPAKKKAMPKFTKLPPKKKVAGKPALNNKLAVKKDDKRTRTARPYPVVPYNQATTLGEGIHKHASGNKIRLLRLLELLELNPGSSGTRMLITNSGKYGITVGGYTAEFLELTDQGMIATNPDAEPRAKLTAQFALAIDGIPAFKMLYDEYKSKRLVAHGVMIDLLRDNKVNVTDYAECVDIFIANVKALGLLRQIGGSENLIPIEQALDEADKAAPSGTVAATATSGTTASLSTASSGTDWENICFYVTPIGDEGTETRWHSDLFKDHIIEPAMVPLGLRVVRADQFGRPDIITSNVIEHLKRARLVIADLSMLNPNVFYEIALRHACRLPIVQIRRKGERLPFDVGQVNTIEIDNSSLYAFVPKMETFKAEIASLARTALQNPEGVSNVITVFYPKYWD